MGERDRALLVRRRCMAFADHPISSALALSFSDPLHPALPTQEAALEQSKGEITQLKAKIPKIKETIETNNHE